MKRVRFRLDELMDEKGVSVTELSRATGISRNTIRSYMGLPNTYPVKNPAMDIIAKLCAFFDCEVGDILILEDESNPEYMVAQQVPELA